MPVYYLIPQDVLYFGGGQQPMTPWPVPAVVFDALHAALHRAFPQVQLWERVHAFGNNGKYPNRKERQQRFGALQTAGPFPSVVQGKQAVWYFPAAVNANAEPGEKANQPLLFEQLRGGSAGQEPLDRMVKAVSEGRPPAWWTKGGVESWLAGFQPTVTERCEEATLFEREPVWESQAVVVDQNQRRSVTYLRCRDNVALGCLASFGLPGPDGADGLARLRSQPSPCLVVGGRQRLCRITEAPEEPLEAVLPISVPEVSERVKWLLLSPAIFPPIKRTSAYPNIQEHPGGWLPNWVCPVSGQVLLRRGSGARPQASREEWRAQTRQLPPLNCRLIAASIPPLIAYQGWSERKHLRLQLRDARPGPKPACQVVPAGAVYYFEGPDAPELARLLAWHGEQREAVDHVRHRRSTLLGEKGFGLGVCGPWNSLSEGLQQRVTEPAQAVAEGNAPMTPESS